MGRRGIFLSRLRCTTSATFLGSISAKLPTNTWPGAGSQHMVSYSRKVSIKGSNLLKKPLFRVPVPYLWSAYRSRETFCNAYTLSIPKWTSHRCAFPGWLLLRDVPFSTYPPPKVSLSAMGIPGWDTVRRLRIILLYLPWRRFRENGIECFDHAVPKCLLAFAFSSQQFRQ